MLPMIAEHLGLNASNKEGWLSGLCGSLLERQKENNIELHVAFPVEQSLDGYHEQLQLESGCLFCYGFLEDTIHPESYDEGLEVRLKKIADAVQPDVVHCFGTEYPHHLAIARVFPYPERILVGIQGICSVIAEDYMADLPLKVQKRKSLRDYLKKDGLTEQQKKFMKRGIHERELLRLVGNVTGRTDFDRYFAEKINPQAKYFRMNETMRECFYDGCWDKENCNPHQIFVSQGDYPLKGLHYMLLAAAELKKRYPDLQLRVAGNSLINYDTIKDKIKISGYGKYLRKLIKENQLDENVVFLGRLSAVEMKKEYLSCGVFVSCSANENSPNSLAEAMMLGVPCVASNVGGTPSVFTGGEDGILYESGRQYEDTINNICNSKGIEQNKQNIDTIRTTETTNKSNNYHRLQQNVTNLMQAVVTIWENPEETAAFCENARKHARKTHDREANYKRMVEIYAEIAGAER